MTTPPIPNPTSNGVPIQFNYGDNSYHPVRNLENQPYVFGNIRGGVETEKWGVTLYVKNVTDKAADLFIANNLQSQNRVSVNQPRTFGFTVDFKM